MSIFEYIRIKWREFIDKKSSKKIGSGEEERRMQERKEFKRKIKETPIYNRNSFIYTILRHYKLSEDFARNTIIQEEIKSVLEDKVYDKYGHRDIESISMEEILNLLERDITVIPNSVTIRKVNFDENSSQIYFINILKTRKRIKILEEDTYVYKTYCTINKNHREYNKYNVLMKKINETEIRDKYKKDSNTHDIITITRSEDNPFIMSYEIEDVIESTKNEGRIYYSDSYSCLDLQEYNMYENGQKLEGNENDIPEYYIKMLTEKIKSLDTADAKNFLAFCREKYPQLIEDSQTIIE